MGRFIVKRIIMIIPMMLAITFIVFALVSLSPVNPGRLKLGVEATEEQVNQINEELGVNDPFLVQYFNWVIKAVQGDFGESYYRDRPVMDDILARWPNTILLTFLSIVIAMVIGIPLGVLAAVKQYSWMDRVFTTSAMFFAAIPTFCMATLFVLLFSHILRWVPASGVTMGVKSWILPSMTLGISYSASFLRFTRSTMLETIRQDYIRTARSKGLPEKTVIWGHAFRNALLPLITITGMNLGGLLGGAVIMESVFVIPGLGTLVLDSIQRNDIPICMAAISMLAFTYLIIMLIVDILYAVVDPRIKARYQSAGRKKKRKQPMEGGAVNG